ncbi:hypothetical protein [Robertmurraya sp.]|uniref:hypothetical protein n=1 Tax=Robertmurraya sp. TaxID=2837525 RepID=UPI00370377C6
MNMHERFQDIWSTKTIKQITKEIESLRKYMQKNDAHYVLHGKSHAPDEMSDSDRLRALMKILRDKENAL